MHATRPEISAANKVENRRVYCLSFESLHPRFHSHVIKFENIRFQLSKRIRKSVGYKENAPINVKPAEVGGEAGHGVGI